MPAQRQRTTGERLIANNMIAHWMISHKYRPTSFSSMEAVLFPVKCKYRPWPRRQAN